MVQQNNRFSIEEGFRQLAQRDLGRFQSRPEFHDPLLVSFQKVPLSRLIDRELEAFYNASGPVELLSRVFRRFRKA